MVWVIDRLLILWVYFLKWKSDKGPWDPTNTQQQCEPIHTSPFRSINHQAH